MMNALFKPRLSLQHISNSTAGIKLKNFLILNMCRSICWKHVLASADCKNPLTTRGFFIVYYFITLFLLFILKSHLKFIILLSGIHFGLLRLWSRDGRFSQWGGCVVQDSSSLVRVG